MFANVLPVPVLRLHRRNNKKIITKAKAPIIPPAIAASGDFEEESLVMLVVLGEGLWVADGICDVDRFGGAKRGSTSVVWNSNLSSWNSVLPFVVESRFVTTAVWKVSVSRGVSKYSTLKTADPLDVWEVMLGSPPSIVNCTEFFPTPPGTVPQTHNR